MLRAPRGYDTVAKGAGGGAGAEEFFSYQHSDGTALGERPGVAEELTSLSSPKCHRT